MPGELMNEQINAAFYVQFNIYSLSTSFVPDPALKEFTI